MCHRFESVLSFFYSRCWYNNNNAFDIYDFVKSGIFKNYNQHVFIICSGLLFVLFFYHTVYLYYVMGDGSD